MLAFSLCTCFSLSQWGLRSSVSVDSFSSRLEARILLGRTELKNAQLIQYFFRYSYPAAVSTSCERRFATRVKTFYPNPQRQTKQHWKKLAALVAEFAQTVKSQEILGTVSAQLRFQRSITVTTWSRYGKSWGSFRAATWQKKITVLDIEV